MAGGVDGLALGTMAAGGLFLFAAIKGKSILGSIQALIKGQSPSTAASANPVPIAADIAGAAAAAAGSVGLGSGTGGSPGQNQGLAKLLAGNQHPDWTTGQQWSDWTALWERESGWSQYADTRKTHAGGDNASSAVFAYGIAQARPYSKMPQSAWPADKGGTSDPTAQVTWGIAYIADTYGSPSAAEAHEQANGWY